MENGSAAVNRYKQEAAASRCNSSNRAWSSVWVPVPPAIYATRRIAELYHNGTLRPVVAFATSIDVWREAVKLGLPMLPEDLPQEIDLTIDGADEVDPQLNLIKGGGGALLREKIAAQASRREIIIVDASKLSPRLGTRWRPVEVLAYGWQSQARFLASLGAGRSDGAADTGGRRVSHRPGQHDSGRPLRAHH